MKNIIFWVIVIIVVVFLSSAVFISLFGKDILVSTIEKSLSMKTSLDAAIYRPPFAITLYRLRIGDIFLAEEISFSINPAGFLAGKIILDGLVIDRPVITLEQSPEGKLNLPQFQGKGKKFNLIPAGVIVKKGKVIFIDKKISPAGFKNILDKINLSILKANFLPTSLRANYRLSAVFTDADSRAIGDLKGEGWFDFRQKDMDGYIEVKGLDASHFQPYYGSFISERKLRSANMNLKADLKSKSNDLAAVCHLELYNLTYEEVAQPQEKQNIFSNTLDLFTNEKGQIALDFTLRTRFDRPVFSGSKFKSVMIKAAGKNLANQPPEKIIDRVSNTIEQFKQMFKKPKK